MRTSEDRSGPLATCTGYTCRSPVLTRELVPVDWHVLPVQVTKYRYNEGNIHMLETNEPRHLFGEFSII